MSDAPLPCLADYPLHSFDKLRYGDTDRQGHVNNAVFATFFETGRVELLLDPTAPIAGSGQSIVIASLTIAFIGEIFWPGRVEIGTRVTKIGRSSVTVEQGLFQGERLVGRGESVLVLMDNAAHRSTPLGEAAVAQLQRFA